MDWKDEFPQENRYFETDNGILYCGEAIQTMSKFPEKIFDAIITDPPYGTTACKWDTVIPFDDMWRELKRIRKDRTPVVLFGSEPFSTLLRASNLKEFRYDWIWNKKIPSGMNYAKYQPMRQHEIISVFYRKKCLYKPQMERRDKPIKAGGMKNSNSAGTKNYRALKKIYNYKYPISILSCQKIRQGSLHPTQKPLALLEYLVKTYTDEGDLVLDFTCGSGTTTMACEKLNRRWVGIELNTGYCEIVKERILNGLEK